VRLIELDVHDEEIIAKAYAWTRGEKTSEFR
jgi:hypothetical protein